MRLNAALLPLMAVVACAKYPPAVEVRLQYWDARLKSELSGTRTLEEATQFFARNGLQHSFDRGSRTLHASERDVAMTSPTRWSVHIECRFDSFLKLEGCETRGAKD